MTLESLDEQVRLLLNTPRRMKVALLIGSFYYASIIGPLLGFALFVLSFSVESISPFWGFVGGSILGWLIVFVGKYYTSTIEFKKELSELSQSKITED